MTPIECNYDPSCWGGQWNGGGFGVIEPMQNVTIGQQPIREPVIVPEPPPRPTPPQTAVPAVQTLPTPSQPANSVPAEQPASNQTTMIILGVAAVLVGISLVR